MSIFQIIIKSVRKVGQKIIKSKTTYYIVKVAKHPIVLGTVNNTLRVLLILRTMEVIKPELSLIRYPKTPILRKMQSAISVTTFGVASTTSLLANIMSNSRYAPHLKMVCLAASGLAVKLKPLNYELCLLLAAHGNNVSPYLLFYFALPKSTPSDKGPMVIIPNIPNYPLLPPPPSYPDPSVSKIFDYELIHPDPLVSKIMKSKIIEYAFKPPKKSVSEIIETIRMMEAIRRADPDVILNSNK
jgi:hypothetical protein